MGVFPTRARCASRHTRSPIYLALGLAIWTIIALAPFAAVRAADGALCSLTECTCARATHRDHCSATSPNFEIRSFVSGPAAADVAKHCEEICARLRRDVFELDATRWQPRCVVMLHASRQSYARSVGGGGNQTVGSSNVLFTAGRVSQRRIDLLAVDVEKGLAALPHELIHVLFADAFPDAPPPKWAEEGLALLVDAPDKQSRHRRDLATSAQNGTLLPLNRLLANPNYPATPHRAAFYAQSLSLVEFLTHERPPKEFVRFVRLAVAHGPDHALDRIYGLDANELEGSWRRQLKTDT